MAANTWLGCISADLHADPESTAKPAASNSRSNRSASTLLTENEKNFEGKKDFLPKLFNLIRKCFNLLCYGTVTT